MKRHPKMECDCCGRVVVLWPGVSMGYCSFDHSQGPLSLNGHCGHSVCNRCLLQGRWVEGRAPAHCNADGTRQQVFICKCHAPRSGYRNQCADALTADDVTSALANARGELRYLWTSNGLPQNLMAALALAGFGLTSTFSSLAEDRASTAVVMRTGFGIDEATSLQNRGLVVRVHNAIEPAKKRRTKQDGLDAEARSSRLPKLIPKEDYGRMKTAVKSSEHSLDKKETPSQNLVERRLNMIEADEPKTLKWES